MTLDLSDDEKFALTGLLTRTIENDPYPLSPRVLTLKAILAKIEPRPVVAKLRPELERSTDANLVAHPSHRVGLPNYPAAAIGC
jgi:hypothetical protein